LVHSRKELGATVAFLRRKSDKIDLLAMVPLFANLSKAQLGVVSRAADEMAVTDGEMLARQGAAGDEAFVVIAGELTVRRNGRKVATLSAGDVVGEMALIDGGTRSADVVAAGDGGVLVMHRREFGGILDEVPAIQRKLMVNLSQRLREADRKLYG
jgi:CRP-like cAMP-binding protein